MNRSNLKTDLLAAVEKTGETIEAIVVGRDDATRWREEENLTEVLEDIVLTPEKGLALLDKDYDSGYGGADCRPFYAWTQTRVYQVHEYDGATRIGWVPRHPSNGAPDFG